MQSFTSRSGKAVGATSVTISATDETLYLRFHGVPNENRADKWFIIVEEKKTRIIIIIE